MWLSHTLGSDVRSPVSRRVGEAAGQQVAHVALALGQLGKHSWGRCRVDRATKHPAVDPVTVARVAHVDGVARLTRLARGDRRARSNPGVRRLEQVAVGGEGVRNLRLEAETVNPPGTAVVPSAGGSRSESVRLRPAGRRARR